MTLNRRHILGGAALAAIAPHVASAATPSAMPPAASATPTPSLNERLAKAAREHRYPVAYDGKTFSGPGWERIVEEGRRAQFFLVGEEHGVAQVPALGSALIDALRPAGYDHIGIEISPPIAADVDRAAVNGVPGLVRYYADAPPGPAFYTYAEEAAFIAHARGLFPASHQLIWGMDYEVLQDRRLIGLLDRTAPRSARPALAALDAASKTAAATFAATRNPGALFTFSGDPALVTAVKAAWPHPDPESGWILETLEATLIINQHNAAERYHQSNQTRADFNRANFIRYWNTATRGGKAPKAMFKMGGNHMMRGRSTTECYDLGSLISECAALRGGSSYHLLVGPGVGSKIAAFNPSTMKSEAVTEETWSELGIGALAGEAFPSGFTLIDLKPMRDWLPNHADVDVSRIVRGFDAMLVLTGSTPSTAL